MPTPARVPSPVASNPELDYLLVQIAEATQLTPTQYEKANGHYTAAGDWLAASESPLLFSRPRMYPQGSMRIGTTVKPRGEVEYDLDLVCQVGGNWTPMALYNAVYDRLYAHETYRPKLKKKKRCLCLEYAGDFHLDIIPAVADTSRGGTCILIPDRNLKAWTPSNPKGYAEWFEHRSIVLMERVAKADAEPLPAQQAAADKQPLAVAVQLMKRARDVKFDGSDNAPRSVILTTLAGEHYSGGASVTRALVEVARAIQFQAQEAAPEMIKVVNPTNTAENFCDGMTTERHKALVDFARLLETSVVELTTLRGPPLFAALEKLFDRASAGERFVKVALEKFQREQKSLRDAGTLKASATGLGIVAPVTSGFPVRGNTYFGD